MAAAHNAGCAAATALVEPRAQHLAWIE